MRLVGSGHMAAVVSKGETAVCRPVEKGSGYSEFCLATGWMELSPGPWSMGLSLKRGPSKTPRIMIQELTMKRLECVE